MSLSNEQWIDILVEVCGGKITENGRRLVIVKSVGKEQYPYSSWRRMDGSWIWNTEFYNLDSIDAAVTKARELNFYWSFPKFGNGLFGAKVKYGGHLDIVEGVNDNPAHALWLALLEAVRNGKSKDIEIS